MTEEGGFNLADSREARLYLAVGRMIGIKQCLEDLMRNDLKMEYLMIENFREPVYDWVGRNLTEKEYEDMCNLGGSGEVFSSDLGEELLSKVFKGGYKEFSYYLTDLEAYVG